jgi:intracellular septation protein A
MLFALLLGFMIGISTPNFGALVRFKIPFVPFLVAGLYIIDHLNRKRLYSSMMNRQFRIQDYLWGDAGPPHCR